MIFEYVTAPPDYMKIRDYIEKVVQGSEGLMLFRKHESHYSYFIPHGKLQLTRYELSCEFKNTFDIIGWRITDGVFPTHIIQNPLTMKKYPAWSSIGEYDRFRKIVENGELK